MEPNVEDWSDKMAIGTYFRNKVQVTEGPEISSNQALETPLVNCDSNQDASKALSDSISDFFMLGKFLPLDRWMSVLNDMLFSLEMASSERHKSSQAPNIDLQVGETEIPTWAEDEFHEKSITYSYIDNPTNTFDAEKRQAVKVWDIVHGNTATKGDILSPNATDKLGVNRFAPLLNENAFSNEETVRSEWVPIDLILPELKEFFKNLQFIGTRIQKKLGSLVRQKTTEGFITREWTIKREIRRLNGFLHRINRNLHSREFGGVVRNGRTQTPSPRNGGINRFLISCEQCPAKVSCNIVQPFGIGCLERKNKSQGKDRCENRDKGHDEDDSRNHFAHEMQNSIKSKHRHRSHSLHKKE